MDLSQYLADACLHLLDGVEEIAVEPWTVFGALTVACLLLIWWWNERYIERLQAYVQALKGRS